MFKFADELSKAILEKLKREGLSIILLVLSVTVLAIRDQQNKGEQEKSATENRVRIEKLEARVDECRSSYEKLLVTQVEMTTNTLKENTDALRDNTNVMEDFVRERRNR
jgi:uncharacterized protein YlxW (UPF0749 family)